MSDHDSLGGDEVPDAENVKIRFRLGSAELELEGPDTRVSKYFDQSLDFLRELADVLPQLNTTAQGPTIVELPSPPMPLLPNSGLVDASSVVAEDGASEAATTIAEFAKRLQVDIAVIEGTCDPSMDQPYIRLDIHTWSAFRRALPSRGPNAISRIGVVATLLALWLQHAQLPLPKLADANTLLETVDKRDDHPTRGITRCDWLRLRDHEISLNPAKLNKAVAVTRAYCLGEAPKWDE